MVAANVDLAKMPQCLDGGGVGRSRQTTWAGVSAWLLSAAAGYLAGFIPYVLDESYILCSDDLVLTGVAHPETSHATRPASAVVGSTGMSRQARSS